MRVRGAFADVAVLASCATVLIVACTDTHGSGGPDLTTLPNNGDFVPPVSDAGTVVDDDASAPAPEVDAGTPAIEVTAPANPETTEGGGTVVLSVRLARRPDADVIVPVVVSGTEAFANASSLAFTPDDWSSAQSLVITGKDDSVADGDVSYDVTLGPATSADDAYAGLSSSPVKIVNLDDDTPGIVVKAVGTTTTELGGTATVDVRLASKPLGTVTIPVSTSKPSEATVPFASISFDGATWSTPQAIVVTGVDDAIADGTTPFTLVLGPATSSDPAYAGRDPADVAMANQDRPRDGASQGNAATTCAVLHATYPALPTGTYFVDPEGGATADAFATTCDMTLDGGGFAMLGRGQFWTAVDDALGPNTTLGAARRGRIVAASTKLYRLGSGASRLYVQDASARFDVGVARWHTDGNALTCATTYAAVQGQTMASVSTFAVTCDPLAPGAFDCALGAPNGWILWADGDTYDPSGTHPCSFGAAEAPTAGALVDLWVR